MHVHHINLQKAVGGGEVYTRLFTKAMVDAGARITLYVDPDNRFWDSMSSPEVEVVRLDDPAQIAQRIPARGAVLMTQSRIPMF